MWIITLIWFFPFAWLYWLWPWRCQFIMRHFNQCCLCICVVGWRDHTTEANKNTTWKTIMGLRAWIENEAANRISHLIWFVQKKRCSCRHKAFKHIFSCMEQEDQISAINMFHIESGIAKMSAENLITGWAYVRYVSRN